MFCVEHSTFNRGNTEYTCGAFHAVFENLIFPCLAAFQVFSHRANQVYLYLCTQAIPWLRMYSLETLSFIAVCEAENCWGV